MVEDLEEECKDDEKLELTEDMYCFTYWFIQQTEAD